MAPDITTSSEIGLNLLEAIEKYSDPKKWRNYLRASEYEHSDSLTYIHPSSIHGLGNGPESEQILKPLWSKLLSLLSSEKLWGVGYMAPVGPEDPRVIIPADKWQILRLDFEANVAATEHLSFSGVLIFETLEIAQQNSAPISNHRLVEDGQSQARNPGGRPPKYDWDAFYCEVVRIANAPDGLPEKPADLQRQMAEWFQDAYAMEPAESEIKKRVRRIYQSVSKEGEN